MKPERIFSLIVILVCITFLLFGCVGNKAGINSPLYVAPEKPSVMQEVDQGVETAGKVLRFIGVRK